MKMYLKYVQQVFAPAGNCVCPSPELKLRSLGSLCGRHRSLSHGMGTENVLPQKSNTMSI